MTLLDLLLRDAKAIGADPSGRAAYAWLQEHAPDLWVYRAGENESDPAALVPIFDWVVEWPAFRENLAAVVWVVEHRRGTGVRRVAIPAHVRQVVDRYVAMLRVSAAGTHAGELELRIVRTRTADSQLLRPADLDEFWQMMVARAIDPSFHLALSVCSRCGKELKPTARGRPSRASFCPSCRNRRWIDAHPEEAREAWKLAKREQRNSDG